MSLLPPQFQTHLPHTLGAKITAMPAPPKPPHVHQWVAVPDSKIHSRCAECGTVTLTEIVAPKPAASGMSALWAKEAVRLQQGLPPGSGSTWPSPTAADIYANGLGAGYSAYLEHHFGMPYTGEPRWVAHTQGDRMPVAESEQVEVLLFNGVRASERRLATWTDIREEYQRSQAPEIKYSAFVTAVRDFFAGSASRALAMAHARSVLDAMGYKKMVEVPQNRRAEFLEALTTQPQRHYTSITAPDGKVRMVETDAEGWIKNDGTQPVADDVRVDMRNLRGRNAVSSPAQHLDWATATHWRPAA